MKLIKTLFAVSCAIALVPSVSAQQVLPTRSNIAHSKGYADLENCNPVRPENAPQNKETRTMSFAFLVGEDGQLRQSKITMSSGSRKLDRAALAAFQHCTFHPATAGGRPEQSWVMLNYTWDPAAPK